MARKQTVPLEIVIPEEPGTRGSVETAQGNKTKRTRAKAQPARSLGQWLRLLMQWTAALAIVAVIIGSIYQVDRFLATSPRFYLPGDADTAANPNFVIQGIRHTPRERIARVFNVDFGRSVFLMTIADRRAQLLRIDWVQEASVSRLWPNRIVVDITERKPVAFVSLPEMALIDAAGVILSPPEKAQFQLPVLRGIARTQSPEMRRDRVQMMLEMLKQVGQTAAQISEIDAENARDLQVTLPGSTHAYRLHLGNRNYASRLRTFFTYIEEISKRYPTYTVFDMRLDGNMTAMETKPDGK